MELSPTAEIKIEEFEGYQKLRRVRSSLDLVADRLTKGVLAKDPILERYTEQISLHLDDDPEALQNIKANFARLADSSGKLSDEKLQDCLSEALPAAPPNFEVADAVATLTDLLKWHSSFPFPASHTSDHDSLPLIDEPAFVRAVGLLTLDPPLFNSPDLTGRPFHSGSGGSAPEAPGSSLTLITYRGKDGQDYRRRLFRSLSSPKADGEDPVPVFLNVPRLVVSRDGISVWYMTKEDERWVDLLDVLAETVPGCRRPMPNPTRAAFELALPDLPKYELSLSGLQVPHKKMEAFVGLLTEAGPSDELPGLDRLAGLVATKFEACRGETDRGLTWEEFNEILSVESCTASIAEKLDGFYSIFKKPIVV